MNFRFTKSRSLINRYYTPRGLYRNSGRYWDYALYPFWDEMNVGIAQGAVQSFVRTPENSSPVSSCNRELNIETAPRTLRLTIPPSSPSSSTVNVHWLETPTSHIFRADVPGLRREDLSILVEGSILQISGHRNLDRIPTDVNERIQWEVSFVRRFRLPTTAVMEQISAMLDHGVLTLTIPKLPIPPSVSWFVPVNSCPPQIIIRNWNPQEQSQPDSHGSDQGSSSTTMVLGRPQIEPRTQECNFPSSLSVQSVSLKERDDNPTSSSDINVPIDPKLASKTLNIRQEEGTGPNAKVTLNININTGKVSAEGESSSVQITPTSQIEDQNLLLDGSPRSSSRSHSISPRLSTLKPRSSLAQTQDYQAEEVDSPPSTLRRKSSVQIEDDEETDPRPTTSRRKSSIQIEDDEETDPRPTTSRRKSSIQIEDDKEMDPSPYSSRRKSSIQMDDNQDVDVDPPSSKRQSILKDEDFEDDDSDPRPSTLRRKSSIKIDDQGTSDVETMDNRKRLSLGRQRTRQSTKRGSQMQPSVVANNEGERTSDVDDFAINNRRRSSKRGSRVSGRQSSVVANDEGADERGSTSKREDSMINDRQRSSKRDSSIVKRQPSIVDDGDEEEDTSDVDDWSFNKRKGSTKDRSNSRERRESIRESSPGSARRKSRLEKRGSVAKAEGGRRESTDNLSRRRESSLGLGADLTKSSNFDDREDEEET